MTIKTLHITNFYHPSSGGVRTFYNALVSAANRHRRPVRLVVPAEKTSVEDIGEFGRIYYIAAPRVPVLDSRYRWMLPHTYAWPYDSPLRRIFAHERPDLVEVCDKYWLLYLSGILRRKWIRGLPVPVIVGLTCERLDNNMAAYIGQNRFLKFAHERYMRWCYAPRFDFHLAASHYIAEEVRAVLPERLKDRLYVAPMGVDVEAFRHVSGNGDYRQSLLRRVNGGEKTLLLLYAGRLSKEKNLLVLPRMLAHLASQSRADFRLLIAGDGPFAEPLRTALNQHAPGRSLFLGHLSKEALPSLYHAADVFIHPNPREPFGIAPLEAMSSGLPVVAPASGGVLTYADQKNAWLAANTPESFAEAVLSVHDDPVTRMAKTERASATAREFSWPGILDNYFRLYDSFHEQLLSAGAGKSSLSAKRVSKRANPDVEEPS